MKRSDIGPFAIVPEWIVKATHGTAAFLVWYELARRANDSGQAWPSQRDISERTGCDERSVRRAIAFLNSIGAVLIDSRTSPGKGKLGNIYTLVFADPKSRPDIDVLLGSQPDTGVLLDEDTGVLSVNKDEREPTLTLTNSLTPKSPLSDSDTPDSRTPGSVRDLPFTDREQSSSDTPRIETGNPNQAPPPLEGKALRAATPGEQVMAHFRKVTGRPFTSTKAAESLATAVLKVGGTLEAIRLVIDHRNALWGKDEAMRKYLRPETVFRACHWEGYLIDAQEWEALGRPEPGRAIAKNRKVGETPRDRAMEIARMLEAR